MNLPPTSCLVVSMLVCEPWPQKWFLKSDGSSFWWLGYASLLWCSLRVVGSRKKLCSKASSSLPQERLQIIWPASFVKLDAKRADYVIQDRKWWTLAYFVDSIASVTKSREPCEDCCAVDCLIISMLLRLVFPTQVAAMQLETKSNASKDSKPVNRIQRLKNYDKQFKRNGMYTDFVAVQKRTASNTERGRWTPLWNWTELTHS